MSSLKSVRLELEELRQSLPPTGERFSLWQRHRADPVAWVNECELLRNRQGQPVKLDPLQESILRSDQKRILLMTHRQWGKSSIAALICLHQAIFYPDSLCLLVSPALRQSSENFKKVVGFLCCLDDRPLMTEDTKLSLTLSNGSRVISLPGANEGKTVRGYTGPDVIVIDEAAQCSDELFHSITPMQASNPRGKLILCSTPFGQTGFFYQTWSENLPGWLKAAVKVGDTDRIDPAWLEEQRQLMGPLNFQQEFENVFLNDEFSVFTSEMLARMTAGDGDEEDNKEVNIFDY
jgi:hypothetical protein